MSTIYKFTMREFREDLAMPAGARILTAQMQDGRVTLWAQVNPSGNSETRKIRIFGTGHELPPGLCYIATAQDGLYVWHVFEDPAA